jgi:hypothetical protein
MMQAGKNKKRRAESELQARSPVVAASSSDANTSLTSASATDATDSKMECSSAAQMNADKRADED